MISARQVVRRYRRPRRSLTRPGPVVEALRGVDLDVAYGQRLGIVGESGSGKSTLIRLLAGLDRPTSGSIRFAGREITRLPDRSLTFLRRDLQMVFQDPMSSLDPRMTVGDIIREPLVALGHPDSRARVAELLDAVGLPAAAPTVTRTSSPAGSGSGSRSRGPCHPAPRSWSPTSPSARSTCPCGRRSSTC